MRKVMKYRAAVLSCALLASLALASACARQGTPPVIAEKDKSSQSTGEQKKKEGQDLSQALEVPERYQAEKRGELIEIISDAEIVVPQVESIPVRRVTRLSNREEDYRLWKNALEEKTGSRWEEDQTNEVKPGSKTLFSNSEDGMFYLSFYRKDDGEIPARLWFSHMRLSDGERLEEETADRQTEPEIQTEADALARILTSDQLVLHDTEWRTIKEYEQREGMWYLEDHGKTGMLVTYVQSFGGIPVAPSMPLMSREFDDQNNSLELLYASDKRLVFARDSQWKLQDTMEEPSEFLLPFAVIAEVFEQHYLDFYETPGAAIPKDADGTELSTTVRVRKVCLEYQLVWDEKADEGTLIPVWNFYNDGEGAYGRSILLSIDARDGSLPFDMEYAW